MQQFMERLVEKAALNFSKEKGFTTPLLRHKNLTPDISISRDPGSGGQLVAAMVAKKLKWKLLDKAILNELSHEMGIPANEFADIDEHTRNWLSDTLQSITNPNYVSDLHYIAHLKRLILAAAKNEDVVILGRGANLILAPERCLRVRITASFSNRVKNTIKHENKSREEAEEWVRKVESKRAHFVQQYFGVNPYNPWHYDIVVNTDSITLEQASDIIIEAYKTKFPEERKRLAKV